MAQPELGNDLSRMELEHTRDDYAIALPADKPFLQEPLSSLWMAGLIALAAAALVGGALRYLARPGRRRA